MDSWIQQTELNPKQDEQDNKLLPFFFSFLMSRFVVVIIVVVIFLDKHEIFLVNDPVL